MTLDQIPHADLIAMLKSCVWCTGGRDVFKRQGYSVDIVEWSAVRDINYRNEPLYPTPEEAILAHRERHYGGKK